MSYFFNEGLYDAVKMTVSFELELGWVREENASLVEVLNEYDVRVTNKKTNRMRRN